MTNNLDKAADTLEHMLNFYRKSLNEVGEIKSDHWRMRFAGAKEMLRVLAGQKAKDEVIGKLHTKGLKIPPGGGRMNENITGFDMDSDLDFFEWAMSK